MAQTFHNGFNLGTIGKNSYLKRDIDHYWRYRYLSASNGTNTPDGQISEDIRNLKNQFHTTGSGQLQISSQRIKNEISEGLDFLIQQLAVVSGQWVVVAVPRSKANFGEDQLYLIKAISNAASRHGLENGARFILREKDTKTTHLMNTVRGDMNKTGDAPYPGITKKTCSLHGDVSGKNVILIDDIYTQAVNVDEDCAQFLFDNGARNVVLYTLCKT